MLILPDTTKPRKVTEINTLYESQGEVSLKLSETCWETKRDKLQKIHQ